MFLNRKMATFVGYFHRKWLFYNLKTFDTMRKLICSAAAAILVSFGAMADEGMWMLPLLEKLNAGAMKDLGCRLTPDQIYSVNHSSLKDAIVIFGGGCTGEMISDKGLLVTNHHCGYSSIQQLSSDEHNYLENGFWAMNSKEEIPVPGLSVTFLVSMSDVTQAIEDAQSEEERKAVSEALVKASEELNPGCDVELTSFYNNNVHYLIVYKIFKDIRFVGAPPASIGKFGGETDNWMWPRHTGDFSMFRVYAGKDNEPAEYSEDNVPYVPKQSLKISLKGINEGDYTMIMGYPGRTQRYQTEAQLNHMMALNDIAIEARTLRQDIMWKWMEKDPSVRLKYANKYAGSANGWKKWIGEKKAFKDLNIIEKEHDKEARFQKWVDKNKKRSELYGTAIADIAAGIKANEQVDFDVKLLSETVLRLELMNFTSAFNGAWHKSLKAGSDTATAVTKGLEAMKAVYEDYYAPLDKEETSALLKFYREKARSENYLEGLDEDFATMDIDKFVDELFNTTVFTSYEKASEAIGREGFTAALHDPVNKLAASILKVYLKLRGQQNQEAKEQIKAASKAYTAGLMEWSKGKAMYPDANFTMRLTYGTVKSYSPKDALNYRYYSTIYGVMEKEDPDNYEFIVPDKLKQLYVKRDYGRYAMADGNLPCCFLTTNDITGGNSGSPVLNADGELIGLAFDGNWESMSSDVMFEPDLQRCICVDIRYVLFLVDKFGGAGYLTKEMNIVK